MLLITRRSQVLRLLSSHDQVVESSVATVDSMLTMTFGDYDS